MYCNNCHRQCPDNFSSCPYCSNKLKTDKKKKTEAIESQKNKRFKISFKGKIIVISVVAFLLCIIAVTIGLLNGSKPEMLVKTMVLSVKNKDANTYYSLYDEQIKNYNKENWYFDDSETFSAMTEPLEKTIDFYTDKCGKDFTVRYEINEVIYIENEKFNEYCDVLEKSFSYRKLPTEIATVDFVIEVKGSEGEYTSVYDSFMCMKIGGKWYRIYSSVFNDISV